MKNWWKNYKYRFTPYVRGDLSKMKNTRYLSKTQLGTDQNKIQAELLQVSRLSAHNKGAVRVWLENIAVWIGA